MTLKRPDPDCIPNAGQSPDLDHKTHVNLYRDSVVPMECFESGDPYGAAIFRFADPDPA